MKPMGRTGALVLFENESPRMLPGVDELQTSGDAKITVGDGTLFARDAQSLVNAESPHEYGSCQNRLSIVNTPLGIFYISQNQGKVFQVGQSLTEISNIGMKWWFSNFLPYKLIEHPSAFVDRITGDPIEFELTDNPVIGIGCQAVFDNENQVVFFCKKDYIIRDDNGSSLQYAGNNNFTVIETGGTVQLGDPAYFRDASWTVSYDPKSKAWVSYHDWHPGLALPSKNTFLTVKDNGLWVHADDCQSYCNFYGVDYPFEVEFALHTKGQVNTLRNIMYMMEVYQYAPNCEDRFHVLDFNFDEAIVYNSEQCSGLLTLNLMPKNNAPEILTYPRFGIGNVDILYAKEEHKYRFNQFSDLTFDRGEFNTAIRQVIFETEDNGYIRNLNTANINYGKSPFEQKKFRHYKNVVLLRRRVSGNHNMIISTAVQMNLTSTR
jgi:hypothetical protein